MLDGVEQAMGLRSVLFAFAHRSALRLKLTKLDKLVILGLPNLMWSGDFTMDQTKDGRTLRFFVHLMIIPASVFDIEIDFSLPTPRVLRALDWLIE